MLAGPGRDEGDCLLAIITLLHYTGHWTLKVSMKFRWTQYFERASTSSAFSMFWKRLLTFNFTHTYSLLVCKNLHLRRLSKSLISKLNIVFCCRISLTPLLATTNRSWEFLGSTYSVLSRVPAQQQLRPALDNPMLVHICRHLGPGLLAQPRHGGHCCWQLYPFTCDELRVVGVMASTAVNGNLRNFTMPGEGPYLPLILVLLQLRIY